MTVLVQCPRRDALRAVLIVPLGMGWHVGIGRVVTGRIEGDHEAFMDERSAQRAAIKLADAHDLIAVAG